MDKTMLAFSTFSLTSGLDKIDPQYTWNRRRWWNYQKSKDWEMAYTPISFIGFVNRGLCHWRTEDRETCPFHQIVYFLNNIVSNSTQIDKNHGLLVLRHRLRKEVRYAIHHEFLRCRVILSDISTQWELERGWRNLLLYEVSGQCQVSGAGLKNWLRTGRVLDEAKHLHWKCIRWESDRFGRRLPLSYLWSPVGKPSPELHYWKHQIFMGTSKHRLIPAQATALYLPSPSVWSTNVLSFCWVVLGTPTMWSSGTSSEAAINSF